MVRRQTTDNRIRVGQSGATTPSKNVVAPYHHPHPQRLSKGSSSSSLSAHSVFHLGDINLDQTSILSSFCDEGPFEEGLNDEDDEEQGKAPVFVDSPPITAGESVIVSSTIVPVQSWSPVLTLMSNTCWHIPTLAGDGDQSLKVAQ